MKVFQMLLVLTFPFSTWAQIHVSLNGSDLNEGTSQKPMASLSMALRKARELRRLNDSSSRNGIDITIAGGTYYLQEPVFIRPEDSGTEQSPTTIRSSGKTPVILSGGVPVRGWKKLGTAVKGLPAISRGKIWVADVPPGVFSLRQLWVNNKKAIRAKDCNGDSLSRILSWDHQSGKCRIPKSKGMDLSTLTNVEMFIHQWWAIAILRIRSMTEIGNEVELSFHQPESRVQSEHPWPAPWISNETGNSAFYLSGAIQFLDDPGEWHFDPLSSRIYYYPRAGENMATVSVVAPLLENLIRVEGTRDNPVSHIRFKGISFQHTGWLRPSRQGHVPLQAGMYLLDAYKLKIPGTKNKKGLENQAWVGRPEAAVKIAFADHTDFERCRFEHLASTGLDYSKGVQYSSVKGNLFRDIGGSAIVFGQFSDEAFEAHLPYHPDDKREVSGNTVISNNLITDVTNEDWGTVGIAAGFVMNTTIEHNDLSDLNYTGISLGWGWTPESNVMRNNVVKANRIHRYGGQMYDVAGIYTLSAQPGTVICDNEIDSIYKAPYAHLPSHWFYIYSDEGTSGTTIKNNWTPSEKFLQNANGPGNIWQQNGPMVHDSVKRLAGLQTAYSYLLTEKAPANRSKTINNERPVIIELVARDGKTIEIQKLKTLLGENKVPLNSLYQWQNHWVIFHRVSDAAVLRSRIQNVFPDVQTNVYYDAFYEFNRSRCQDTSNATEWEHVLLTANLVADPGLQKEYLDHHAAQFQKWPEVAQGFCNAGFQQLLLYRNGRQLMLVISIPKGKSLDQLNPKTTENNPRVDEWNKIMRKYQEGIKGTSAGEVWVFLKPVKLD